MKSFEQLNSPVQFVDEIEGVEIWLKREDLIHPEVSGNKWRKLKYHLDEFNRSGRKQILTYGGAFSNHLAATAALGNMTNIPTIGVVRGEEVTSNSTLDFCRSKGMQIINVSREAYAGKEDNEIVPFAENEETYIIPEGGKGILGIRGCTEILDEVKSGFDFICCSAGTATTFTGLLLSGYQSEFKMFPALKGAGFLLEEVERNLQAFSTNDFGKKTKTPVYTMSKNYHFGGYARVQPELIDFMNDFYVRYQVPLDPVYTAKLLFGVIDEIRFGKYQKGSRVLAIHTGGLQGIKGMQGRIEKMGKVLNYEF